MDDLVELKQLVFRYEGLAVFFCIFLTIASVIGFRCWRIKTKNDMDADAFYMAFIIEACIAFSIGLNIYVKYLGIPTWLTFGYQIGKILPADCEASMLIEGENGLPCSSKRLLEWLGRAMNGDGGWNWDQFEREWRFWLVIAVLMVVVNIAALKAEHIVRVRERRELAMKKCAETDADGLAMQEV